MALFTAGEALSFAIKIEENGEAFYLAFTEKIPDPIAKQAFRYLAEQEIIHKKTFEEMLKKAKAYTPPEAYADEYYAYLKAYADGLIFSKDELDKSIGGITDAASALDFAIQRELDSILYYLEIKNLVSPNEKDAIDRIVEEERKHFIKLNNLKKEVS